MAAAILVHRVTADLISRAFDEEVLAFGTVCALVGRILDVARVYILEPGLTRKAMGPLQRLGRSGGTIRHAEIRMER